MLDLENAVKNGKFPEPEAEIKDDPALFRLYNACLTVYRRGFCIGLFERKTRNALKITLETDKEKELFEMFIRSFVIGFYSAFKKNNYQAKKNNGDSFESVKAQLAGDIAALELKGPAQTPSPKKKGPAKTPPKKKAPPAPQAAKAQAVQPPAPAQAPRPKAVQPPAPAQRPAPAMAKRPAPPRPKGPPQTLKRSRIAASMGGRDSRGFFSNKATRYL